MNQDPCVAASVVFGRGRFQAGIIVEPKPELNFDPADLVQLAKFRNKIWSANIWRTFVDMLIVNRPTVQKVNGFAPQHSRIFKEVLGLSAFPLLLMLYMPDDPCN